VIDPDADEFRKSAALTVGKLKADEYRPEVAEKLEALLQSERDPQVLNGLFNALHSLASAAA
jgi:vesicle coat complex subunit